jgi:hypothetical protein
MPLTFTFRWNKVAAAVDYTIQVSASSGFTPLVINTTTADSFYTVQPGILQGGVTYYWHVRANNCAGSSSYSNTCNFTTLTTLNANVKVYLEGFYNPANMYQVQDTIHVYLANPTSPYALRDSSRIFLGTNGSGSCSFGIAPSGSYYLVVRHRNHLETWSSVAIVFVTGNTTSYDFTTGLSKAYGQNMKQIGSVCVIYSGDINQDGVIFTDDYTILITQFGRDGYLNSDLNGDNFVDGYDLPIIYPNFFHTVMKPQ